MALRITPTNQQKLVTLSLDMGISQSEVVNLLISAVDKLELEQIKLERASSGIPKARVVRIRRAASWSVKM